MLLSKVLEIRKTRGILLNYLDYLPRKKIKSGYCTASVGCFGLVWRLQTLPPLVLENEVKSDRILPATHHAHKQKIYYKSQA